ncbi:MAG: hypothetical protein Athens101410_273 [Parcubacteria group bacterium Athens1014_10]|nr:MAG: hypothetical protein Athens101410_273 [Parcubacteria group bacterium Athens1014_10]TSD04988.1 MAG: hypothetical protein Athens071412_530 [Parcubacteria group bacterium Athens0714_12]
MAIPKKIQNFLEKSKVKYETITHKTVYTAYDLAQTLKTKLQEISKALIVKTEKGYTIVVLPASMMLDLNKLKKILKAKKIEIAKEGVMKKIFKIKPGTLMPFGALYKTPVLMEKSLAKAKNIITHAGSYTDSVKIKMADFLKLENPTQGIFGKKKEIKKKKATKKK